MKRLKALNSFKNSRSKLKKKPLAVSVLSFPRPTEWNNSHADLIWPDGTFNYM